MQHDGLPAPHDLVEPIAELGVVAREELLPQEVHGHRVRFARGVVEERVRDNTHSRVDHGGVDRAQALRFLHSPEDPAPEATSLDLRAAAIAIVVSVLLAGCAAPGPSIRADVLGPGEPEAEPEPAPEDEAGDAVAALDAAADAVAIEREALSIDDEGPLAVLAMLVEAQARALGERLDGDSGGDDVDLARVLAARDAQENLEALVLALADAGAEATSLGEEAALLEGELEELAEGTQPEALAAGTTVTYEYRALLFEDAPHVAAVRALPGEASADVACDGSGDVTVEIARLDDGTALSSGSGAGGAAASTLLDEPALVRVTVSAVAADAWAVLPCDVSVAFVSAEEGLALDDASESASELEAALVALVANAQLDVEAGAWESFARDVVLPHVLMHASVASTLIRAIGGGESGALLDATRDMQETQMSFNLLYLQLQNQMQNENRSYTAISNIMQTKHDTVKNSISNVR